MGAIEINDCQSNESFDTGFSRGYVGNDPVGDVMSIIVVKIAFAGCELHAGLTHGFEDIWLPNIEWHGCSP